MVIVKTVADRMTPWGTPVLDDHSKYTDNIIVLNCHPWWKRFGFRSPWCHRVWIVKDWTGWGSVILTWFLIVFGEVVLFLFVLLPFPLPFYAAANGAFSFVCALLGTVAHVRAAFTDPVSVIESTVHFLNHSILHGHFFFILVVLCALKTCTAFSAHFMHNALKYAVFFMRSYTC
jgi:hypothetical protein